jgi:hypothetical protein
LVQAVANCIHYQRGPAHAQIAVEGDGLHITSKDANTLQLTLRVARRVISTFRIDLSWRELSSMAASLKHSKELSGSESGGKFHDKITFS